LSSIRVATIADLKYIESLANKESKAVGFIPRVAYESAITGKKSSEHRWSDTCNDKIFLCIENEDPVGFVMISYGKIAKVNQICIQEDARRIERGKLLINQAIRHGAGKGIFDFGCGCADDLESNKFWQAMGWDKVKQRKGIHFSNTWKESSGRTINLYRFSLYDLFFLDHNGCVVGAE
jgi:N-acetylglutamate synthase-like GNAT family acetyltransferase